MKAEYELRTPTATIDWQEYHRIRRTVLWEARGRFDYNATHPDDFVPRNLPLLLVFRGAAVGVARLDRQPDGKGVIRRMAIDTRVQRQGHGRTLLNLLEQRARSLGISILEVNSAEDAMTFYRKAGYAVAPGTKTLQKCISESDGPGTPRVPCIRNESAATRPSPARSWKQRLRDLLKSF